MSTVKTRRCKRKNYKIDLQAYKINDTLIEQLIE